MFLVVTHLSHQQPGISLTRALWLCHVSPHACTTRAATTPRRTFPKVPGADEVGATSAGPYPSIGQLVFRVREGVAGRGEFRRNSGSRAYMCPSRAFYPAGGEGGGMCGLCLSLKCPREQDFHLPFVLFSFASVSCCLSLPVSLPFLISSVSGSFCSSVILFTSSSRHCVSSFLCLVFDIPTASPLPSRRLSRTRRCASVSPSSTKSQGRWHPTQRWLCRTHSPATNTNSTTR